MPDAPCTHALGYAGQPTARLMFRHHGGMGKRRPGGQAARAATFGALLAANGFTNADNRFEAEHGGSGTGRRKRRAPKAAQGSPIRRLQ